MATDSKCSTGKKKAAGSTAKRRTSQSSSKRAPKTQAVPAPAARPGRSAAAVPEILGSAPSPSRPADQNTVATTHVGQQAYPELSDLDDKGALALCQRLKEQAGAKHALICFMLDFLPAGAVAAGLELATMRRAELLRSFCGVESWLLTHYYQPDLVENARTQLQLGRLSIAHLANLYDFAQDVNRSTLRRKSVTLKLNAAWQIKQVGNTTASLVLDPSGRQLMYIHRHESTGEIDYVNFIKDDKIIRRDTYDPLGFLSRTELLSLKDGYTHSAILFRPDRSIALIETYQKPLKAGDRPVLESINVLDREGNTLQRFSCKDELVAWWLLQLLSDKETQYLCVCDEVLDYQRYFVELKRQQASYPNVKVAVVAHSAHTLDPEDYLHSQVGDNYLFLHDQNQKVDRVVTLTHWQKEAVEARFGRQAHPIAVIPHPISDKVLKALKAGRSLKDYQYSGTELLPPHSVVLIGRFSEGKNHALSLELIQKVRAQVPDATLHFYGVGELEEKVRSTVREQGLEEIVFFHGFQPDLTPVYLSASLLLSFSRFEGFSLVILEALAQGCPVVAFDCAYGPRSLIAEGVDGYLVPMNDVNLAVSRVVTLLKDEALHRSFSAAATREAARFTPLKVTALWAALLCELLQPAKEVQGTVSAPSEA